MTNSKFCDAIIKIPELKSETRLCCSEESCSPNPPRCPISSHSNLIHCRRIGSDLEACQRKNDASDKNAQEICQSANSDKLFCLRVHDTKVPSWPSSHHDWLTNRFNIADSGNNTCVCCDKKNCATSNNYGVCDFSTSTNNLNSAEENEIKCLQCPDIFQEGGGMCDFYYPNGTRLPNWFMVYQNELCEITSLPLLSTDQIIGITFGIVGFIGVIATIITWLFTPDRFKKRFKRKIKETRDVATQTEQLEDLPKRVNSL